MSLKSRLDKWLDVPTTKRFRVIFVCLFIILGILLLPVIVLINLFYVFRYLLKYLIFSNRYLKDPQNLNFGSSHIITRRKIATENIAAMTDLLKTIPDNGWVRASVKRALCPKVFPIINKRGNVLHVVVLNYSQGFADRKSFWADPDLWEALWRPEYWTTSIPVHINLKRRLKYQGQELVPARQIDETISFIAVKDVEILTTS